MAGQHRLPQMIPPSLAVHTAVSKSSTSSRSQELNLLPVSTECDTPNGAAEMEEDSTPQMKKVCLSAEEANWENNTEECLNGESQQSRYGRIRKRRSLGPDMQLTPLFRTYKRNKADETDKSQSSLDSWVIHKKGGETNGANSSSEANHRNDVVPRRRGRPSKGDSGSEAKEIVRHRGRPPKLTSNDVSVKNLDGSCVDGTEDASNSPRDLGPVCTPLQCNIGDLLWSKIPGHPWWPSMVAYNPFKDTFTRIVKKKNGSCRSFHVQYFGSSAQRGWTVDGGVMVFEGRKAFETLSQQALETSKNPKYDRFLLSLKIPQTRLASWELAVEEAESALKMSHEERIKELTFEYRLPHGKRVIPIVAGWAPTEISTPKKQNRDLEKERKHNEVEIEKMHENEEKQPSEEQIETTTEVERKWRRERRLEKSIGNEKKRQSEEQVKTTTAVERKSISEACSKEKTSVNGASHFNGREDYSESTNDTARVNGVAKDSTSETSAAETSPSRLKTKNSGFDAFAAKHIGNVIEEYPEFSQEEAEGYLQFQWDTLLQTQKIRYEAKFEDDSVKHLVNGEETLEREKRATRTLSNNNDRTSEADTDNSETSSAKDEKSLQNGDSFRHDKVCHICEVTGNTFPCKGPCMQNFHRGCVGLTKVPATFLCQECSTGEHKCFSCKKDDGKVQKCSISSCGRYYHQACLDEGTISTHYDNRIVCPLHTCLTCFIENSKSQHCRKGRMLRCLRCPTAYHTGGNCIAAGSILVTPAHIICAKHFQPKKNNRFHLHVNATWCFVCSEGGKLICCESCPGAFHPECLEIEPPEGNYYCSDCVDQKHPCYGDIVWVKLGCYRWWPAKVKNPNCIPLNIQNLEHNIGEFPVQFYGSHDYFWVHKGRVFLFHEGDRGTKDSSSGRYLAQVFQRAVEEATEAFQMWKCGKETRVAQIESSKPPPYKHIKSNRPVGKVQITPMDLTTLTACECDPEASNPCGNDTECMNRMLMFECHPSMCPAGESCRNQRFQKREYAAAKPFRTEGRGWGLQAEQDIKAGEFVSEYVGELIDEEECKKRLQQSTLENVTNFYFLTIEKDKIVDAGPKGNLSRFMNHSCQPNCETQKWTVNGDTRVGLFAICDILSGTELTFNYNLDCCGNDKLKCSCASVNCSGYIGVQPKTANAASQEKKIKENAGKKRKKKSFLRKHDDECYRCGEGGELMMCDRKTCTKSYHLNCLGLTKPSHGRWDCPWHHCDDCGNTSTLLCSFCPNSFCKIHATADKIWTGENGRVQCSEHQEDGNQSPDDGT